MKIKIFGGLLIAALAITSIAKAQDRPEFINHREHNQERRIDEGVRSGELTRGEAYRLRGDERRIREEKFRDERYGRMSYGERAHLRREEDRTSRAIYRDKHNDRVR